MSADKKDETTGTAGGRLTAPPTTSEAGSGKKRPVTLSPDDQQVADIAAQLVALGSTAIDEILPLAKWSLESVTHLTEYEDEKANRILTAIAFLSALVGVVFAAIVQRYPFSSVADAKSLSLHPHALLVILYCLFGIYFLLLTIGAAFTM